MLSILIPAWRWQLQLWMVFVLGVDVALMPAWNVSPLLGSRVPTVRLWRWVLKSRRAKPPIFFGLPAHELLRLVNAEHSSHRPVGLEVLEIDRYSCAKNNASW